MDFFHAIVLSIVEGITEFLPISSTGHLILTSSLLKIPDTEFLKTFEISIQVGAIFAVVFLYWKDFIKSKEIWKRVLTAFVPTAIVGFILYKFIKTFLLSNVSVVLWSLSLGGILLIILEQYVKNKKLHTISIEQMSYRQSVIVGIFQSIAVIPGVSRSAATIFGALLQGIDRETAVEFSFLLAVPTMIAASGLDIVKTHVLLSSAEIFILLLGIAISFITAILAVKFFVRYISRHTFIGFGVYRIVIAILYYLFFFR